MKIEAMAKRLEAIGQKLSEEQVEWFAIWVQAHTNMVEKYAGGWENSEDLNH